MTPRSAAAHAQQGQRIELRDGSAIVVRPIRASDKAAIAAAFDRLSDESRYRRFLSPMPHLSRRQLEYFTELDHHDHEALIAFDERTRDGVAVARFVRSKVDPEAAEAAVTVADDWQGRGVGTKLLQLLADRARAEGVRRFTATLLAQNRSMLELLEQIGPAHASGPEAGVVEVEVELPPQDIGEKLRDLLRSVADGRLLARMRPTPEGGSEADD